MFHTKDIYQIVKLTTTKFNENKSFDSLAMLEEVIFLLLPTNEKIMLKCCMVTKLTVKILTVGQLKIGQACYLLNHPYIIVIFLCAI